MNRPVSLGDRFRYWFDNQFSSGTGKLIIGLSIISFFIIFIAALILTLTGFSQEGGNPLSFYEAFWEAMMRTFDAGTMGADTGWGFRVVMLLLPTLGGLFIISSLIGVLTSGIESRLEELSKGRSKVIESGHTIILGWSEQVFSIISELAIANENQPRSCIVVMGEKDKVEMEGEIRLKVGSTGKTRLVCRSGNPIETANLDIVSINTSKSIIIVSPDSEEPDSEVIKTVLAITHHPERRKGPYNIVAEIRDVKNMAVTKVVGRNEVEWVLVGDVVARVIAQTCRQSGLSVVYTELLDFSGDEIYFCAEPALTGKTFSEALNWFESNTLMGIMTAGERVKLNPPMDTVIQDDDQLILIAEDDDKIFLNSSGPGAVDIEAISNYITTLTTPEQILLLGWNWRSCSILHELDQYVSPGSRVLIIAEGQVIEDDLARCLESIHNLSVNFESGDITDRRKLDSLALNGFQHVIVLCYSDTKEPQQADAVTLITLLHLRDIADQQGFSFTIVSEMMDIRNRNLADVTRADDFVVSDKLISLMMAQISENRHLNAVFTDLFDPEGSEIYLKPAADYIQLGRAVNFYTVVKAASRRNEVAIGYRIIAEKKESARSYGIHINPLKNQAFTFHEGDQIIVLAEN
jgi:voltage-gated potassium channel Kch